MSQYGRYRTDIERRIYVEHKQIRQQDERKSCCPFGLFWAVLGQGVETYQNIDEMPYMSRYKRYRTDIDNEKGRIYAEYI